MRPFKFISITILLFICIYGLNINPLYTYYVLFSFSFLFCILHQQYVYTCLKFIKVPLALLAIASIYGVLIDVEPLTTNSYGIVQFRSIFETVITSIFIIFLIKRWKLSLLDVYNCLILCSIIQFVFALLMLSNLNLKVLLLTKVLSGGSEEDLVVNSLVSMYRGFGFAKGLLFSFPLLHGIFAALSLMLFLTTLERKYEIFYSLAFIANIILVILNARIGFSPIYIIILLVPFYFKSCFTQKKIMSLIVLLVIGIVISPFVANIFQQNETLDSSVFRAVEGHLDVFNITRTDKYSTFTAAKSQEGSFLDYFFFPDSFKTLLIGDGIKLGVGTEKYSDFGYVRYIFFGGLIYSLLVYVAYIKMSLRLVTYYNNRAKIYLQNSNNYTVMSCLGVLILLSLLVAQFKGEIFTLNEVVRFVMFICVYYSVDSLES